MFPRSTIRTIQTYNLSPAAGETQIQSYNLSSSAGEIQIQTYNLSPSGGETQRGGGSPLMQLAAQSSLPHQLNGTVKYPLPDIILVHQGKLLNTPAAVDERNLVRLHLEAAALLSHVVRRDEVEPLSRSFASALETSDSVSAANPTRKTPFGTSIKKSSFLSR